MPFPGTHCVRGKPSVSVSVSMLCVCLLSINLCVRVCVRARADFAELFMGSSKMWFCLSLVSVRRSKIQSYFPICEDMVILWYLHLRKMSQAFGNHNTKRSMPKSSLVLRDIMIGLASRSVRAKWLRAKWAGPASMLQVSFSPRQFAFDRVCQSFNSYGGVQTRKSFKPQSWRNFLVASDADFPPVLVSILG